MRDRAKRRRCGWRRVALREARDERRRACEAGLVDPERGEHVDGHQFAFARHLAARGLARSVEDEPAFAAAIEAARSDPAAFVATPPSGTPTGVAAVGALIDELVWSSD